MRLKLLMDTCAEFCVDPPTTDELCKDRYIASTAYRSTNGYLFGYFLSNETALEIRESISQSR